MVTSLGRLLFGTQRKKNFLILLIAFSLFIFLPFELYVYLKRPLYHTGKSFHAYELDPQITEMLRQQKCRVPIINPFNEEILPYLLQRPFIEKCRLVKYATVRGDVITLHTTDMEFVELAYINRLDDARIEYFGQVVLLGGQGGEDKDVPSVITHKAKHEFFMIRIFFNDQQDVHKEYHAVFLPQNNANKRTGKESEKTKKVATSDQLNILIVMFDSVSTAHAQRSLLKSYQYLKEHKRTVFMKGHSIVGDGTSAQLCAMLTGTAEGDLPEARRGWLDSSSIDVWPWIFKDLHAKNFMTFFSEDDADKSAFNYRLHGFDDPPTTHYLRPLWQAMSKHYDEYSLRCLHQFNFDYTKRFFDTYKDYNKFGFVINNIAHNRLHTLENADDDILEFYRWLENSEYSKNTLVILMGDHGQRVSEFRRTTHGKLEERLPLLAITYPSKFDIYSDKLKNLRRNSYLLTSHFDTYATIQHLLTFPRRNKKMLNKYGKSFFTNLENINRTCSHAGVAKHWCTCLNYEPVDPHMDTNVVALAKTVVAYINNLNRAKTIECAELKFDRIVRSGRRTPSDEVNRFLKTETLKTGCDSCAVKYSKGIKKMTRLEYEVGFSVSPSGGTYEVVGEVVYKEQNIYISHSSDISRTDLYGKQPECIAKRFPHLRKFCYCRQ